MWMLLESTDFGPDREYIAILSPKQEVVRTKQTQAKVMRRPFLSGSRAHL